jgi:hypothetical protein
MDLRKYSTKNNAIKATLIQIQGYRLLRDRLRVRRLLPPVRGMGGIEGGGGGGV